MKIIFISDTHTLHHELNEDLKSLSSDEETMIIHCGDVTGRGSEWETKDFLDWFSDLPYKCKIFIAGNHDYYFEPKLSAFPPIYPDIEQEYKDKGVIYLMDKTVEINGLKIYGTPWTPRFNNWAFNMDRGEAINRYWKLIPNDIDILISHGPPFGIMDLTNRGIRVGCDDLLVKTEQIKPKIHAFGHIHYSNSFRQGEDTLFINAANLGEDYKYQNKPIMVELDDNKEVVDVNGLY
jgi:Icc-related predicted phosphoesterase